MMVASISANSRVGSVPAHTPDFAEKIDMSTKKILRKYPRKSILFLLMIVQKTFPVKKIKKTKM